MKDHNRFPLTQASPPPTSPQAHTHTHTPTHHSRLLSPLQCPSCAPGGCVCIYIYTPTRKKQCKKTVAYPLTFFVWGLLCNGRSDFQAKDTGRRFFGEFTKVLYVHKGCWAVRSVYYGKGLNRKCIRLFFIVFELSELLWLSSSLLLLSSLSPPLSLSPSSSLVTVKAFLVTSHNPASKLPVCT